MYCSKEFVMNAVTLNEAKQNSGYWSRRIHEEHRLVYAATSTEVVIVACRYHYSK